MKKLFPFVPLLAIILSVFVFFYPFFLSGKLPIPSDTVVGLYYPFRDLYSKTNPNGLPYKNFLITDPVRQQYPWKNLSIHLEKEQTLPIWNPYEMAGTPLLANFQSSVFYPLNVLLFLSPFYHSWSLFIILQPLLAGLFLYWYLKNLKLDARAAFFGAVTWAFCGFSIAWMEWGIIFHTALWLPLILLATDKIVLHDQYNIFSIKKLLWVVVYVLALLSSFLAGHLQTFFYLFIFSSIYFIARIVQSKQKFEYAALYLVLVSFVAILSIPQLIPTLQFIMLSNRVADQSLTTAGWFIPYQNLIQFIVPDFFGNPATLNYFGVWNYGEFIGYAGVVSFVLALYAVLFRRDKKTWVFLVLLISSVILATSNFLSQLPYTLHIPFISTAQPTRLMFVIDACLVILAALGFDYFLRHKKKIWVPLIITGVILGALWSSVCFGKNLFGDENNLLVAKNNLKLPTLILGLSAVLLLSFEFIRNKRVRQIGVLLLLALVLFDLFRFGWKFTPFTNQEYLFPTTQVTSFLQKQKGPFRIASTDSRILPPNFSVVYKLESIEGYDPLYLQNYAEFIAASQRSDHSIKQPFGFNRIITPRNLDGQAIDFLNVKYVVSLADIDNPKYKKLKQYGETRIYENLEVLPRAFFVKNAITSPDRSIAAELVFSNDLSQTAIYVNPKQGTFGFTVGEVKVISQSPNKTVIETQNKGVGMLVVSDSYYPTIHATIDNKETNIVEVNMAFRGLIVPQGKHRIEFEAKLF